VDFCQPKGNHPGFVIPNGVLCREESAGAGGVLAAGKKQIPPLRDRNDKTFYKLAVDFCQPKGNHPGFVIPNGVLCREESAGAGGALAAGKKQIPPLRGRNDKTLARSERQHLCEPDSQARRCGTLKACIG
jgi:hypothetical protein